MTDFNAGTEIRGNKNGIPCISRYSSMMIRVLLLFLAATSLIARASGPISAPVTGASAPVSQPHVVAELIPESNLVTAGKPFDVILHLRADPGWHTYWINPGDAGLATTIKWTLPPGFTAGPIQWPTPEKHNMGPLITFGYEGDVYLITTIRPPATASAGDGKIQIKALSRWLVCEEECIPGKGEFSLDLNFVAKDTAVDFKSFENKELFQAARERLPFPNRGWNVEGTYGKAPDGPGKDSLEIKIANKSGSPETNLGHLQFFPEQSNVLDTQVAATTVFPSAIPSEFDLWIPLVQNGDKPDQISGVLVSDVPLVSENPSQGDTHAVYLSPFSVKEAGAATAVTTAGATSSEQSGEGHRPPLQGESTMPLGTAVATSAAQPLLIVVLGAAFIGGLILNLMPCVLPVLSLKVFSLTKHAGDDPRSAWKQGAAFTAGVVISFWLLAGLLLVLKALGNQLGWGFQMQSPGFILGMIFLFFLLALNLFGVFEIGTSLVGLDAKATGRFHGLTSSFFNGALATLAATPCTGPLMGSTLGFAAQQPASIAMLIFTFLALGMASPYMLLTIFPGALRFIPKPGAWMEAFKQFMGFLLMMAVIWFVEVFGALVGQDRISWLLLALLLTSIAAWIYGRWVSFDRPLNERLWPLIFMLIFLGAGLKLGIHLAIEPVKATTQYAGGYQPWSTAAVNEALAQGRPVFVDFTAAWCLSCKVNERVALDTDAVRQAFKEKNVALFKADWTHADPEISQALKQYNRDGVPLYLLYSPKAPGTPQVLPEVLPEVLTPGIVLDALGRL